MKKNFDPPKYAHRFFRWFCHPALRNYVEGDLLELYDERRRETGKFKADWKFIIDVILLLRPGIVRPAEYQHLNTYGMYKSYFKIGWRNLLKNKGYSLINIGGLASGMAIAILIGLWLWDELSFDRNHENYDRLVQVMQHQTVDGNVTSQFAIPLPLETALRETYGSDFTSFSMATWNNDHILSAGDKKINQRGNFMQVDFPEMFSLKMIAGTRKALKDPASIILSASAAKALFGPGDPMNQLMRIDNMMDVKVTGVYEDLPYNSTFGELQFISSWELYVAENDWIKNAKLQWDNNSFVMFGQVAPGVDVNELSEKIKGIRAKLTKDVTYKPEIFLHPMSDWHLRSNWKNGVKTGGGIQMVWMFGSIGIIVLFLACINFMNLSTARSEKRAKEVGIRMTIGSVRSQLIHQFLSESFLVVVLACIVAVAIVGISLPAFNDLADKRIDVQWTNPVFWLIGIFFIVITSLLAGSYPAFFLSSFRPVNVLKSTFKTGRLASLPRKVLVVVQFAVSIMLVVATAVVNQQIQFSKDRPIGYDRDGLILVEIVSPDYQGKFEALRTDLKNTGAVIEVSESSSPLTEIWSNSSGFNWQGKDPQSQSSDFGIISITHEYGATVGWEIVEGRDLSREFATDSSALLLNEAAVKFIGIKDPLGFEITRGGEKKFHVIGVIRDVVMESPYLPVRHNIYTLDLNLQRANWINIKLNTAQSTSECIAAVESIFKKYAPSVPFDYKFADEEYGKKFKGEERIGTLALVFAGLATFISCLGLIGLASFVAERHTKEIGIRKVLGASIGQIWKLLSGNFVLLVIIASAIAIPLSYYVMQMWLLLVPYHIDMSWKLFAVIELGALGLTILTVSFQAIRAARANPVNSLRSE